MLFTNQKLINGVLIGGDINIEAIKNGVNNSNSVLDPGIFRGAHINKELFSIEEGFKKTPQFFANMKEIDQNISKIITDIANIEKNYDMKNIYRNKYQETIDDSKESSNKTINNINTKENIFKDAGKMSAEDVKTMKSIQKRESAIIEDKRQESLSTIQNVQTRRITAGNGLSNIDYYIGLLSKSEEAFEINKFLIGPKLLSNFSTIEGTKFKQLVESSDSMHDKLRSLKVAIEAEAEKRYITSINKKTMELEEDFKKFKEEKINSYHSSINKRFGNLNNARTSEIVESVEAQRSGKIDSPLRAFKIDELAKRDSMIESFSNTISSQLKKINEKYVGIEQDKTNKELSKRDEQINQINQTAKNNPTSIDPVVQKYHQNNGVRSEEVGMDQRLIDYDKDIRKGSIKIVNERHDKIVDENQESANNIDKNKSKYKFDVSDEQLKLKRERSKFIIPQYVKTTIYKI